MKITLVGALAVVALAVLAIYVVHQLSGNDQKQPPTDPSSPPENP